MLRIAGKMQIEVVFRLIGRSAEWRERGRRPIL